MKSDKTKSGIAIALKAQRLHLDMAYYAEITCVE
jgi:hypothetical protein